ncbi:Inactive serine/threonine-protein kinase TEX14 isoform X1 [Aix galericulata]|nr:Inactive serine/threonine-protein kinase TEX14 isoform X1 [Aix galericulata]
MGQTSLFTAALLGLGKIVDVLLDYGSNPNHRCYDGSTPVHAGAFSGNQWILSKLLDEGGDLRVHDKDGKNPQCWAMSADKESSAQMLEFIQRCTFHMQAAIQNFPCDQLRKVCSSKALVCSPSRFGGLVQGNVDNPLGRFLKGGANAGRDIYSFGFGKFYLAGSRHLGYLASLPIIGEREVVQADDEPTFSYHVGPCMIMTNLMWGSSRVTVKELSFEPHQNCSKLRLADLLIAEQEHSSKLRHPHLLQLMSVCLSSDLEKIRLVYERVNFGSLYSILHERRTEFPVLRMETILHVLLQINDALRFLHSRGFIHRSITSHAIQIVSSGEAKLCNMEYMIESKDGGEHSDLTRIPVPVQLFKWCSPEVILEKVVTVKSDIYSFCTVMQEALTETLPWKGVEDSVIKQLIISGQQLEADVRLPIPYYGIVKSGLEPKQKNRSMNLQDIQYILKNDLKDLTKSQTGHTDEMSKVQRPAVFADINICLASTFSYQKRTLGLHEKEVTEADSSPAPRYSLIPEENNALVDYEASSNLQPVAQEKNRDIDSEVQATCSVSDVDDSLCSFEMNEIFASYPESQEDFLEEGAGVGQTLKDKEKQQKVKDKPALRDLVVSPGAYCEEKPAYEEGSFSDSGTEDTTEEEEGASEVSDLCMLAQVRGDAGRRMSGPSPDEQHISKCVLNLKIIQSMLQQAADSLCRTELKLDKFIANERQKKLLQEMGMYQVSMQTFNDRPWSRSDDIYENTNNPFSGANIFLWKAIGPPSSDYVPPLITREARGGLGGNGFQAFSKAAEEMQAAQNEKWKSFHQMSKSKNENNQHDLSLSGVKSLDNQEGLDRETAQLIINRVPNVLNHGLLDSFQHLLPRVSVRCKNKFNLQCQRGSDSHSAASGSEEERWCYPKSASEIYSTKISEERRMRQPEWRNEVKQMAKRVASGQLELISTNPTTECTSESETESIEEAFQHIAIRVQKSRDQQRERWHAGDNVEPWDTSNLGDKLEDHCDGLLQRRKSEDAGSGIQVSGKCVLSSEDPLESGRQNFINEYDLFPHSSGEAAQELISREPQEDSKEKDISVTDIQDLSSIPCEEENYYKNINCRTPRVSHAPTSVSTPLSSEVSAVSRTFTTAYEEGRSTENTSTPVEVRLSGLNEPVTQSQAPNHFIDDLPPPAQELLDEIEYLKQQDSITQDFEEKGLFDCKVQINVAGQIKMEDRDTKKEMDQNEKRDHSVLTNEAFNLAEETERAHSTLDDVLERILHAVPADQEIQEQPQGHALGTPEPPR